MKILRRIAAPVAALSLAAGVIAAPVAGASEVTPAQVAGETATATISELDAPISANAPRWRQLTQDNERVLHLQAYSPSMGREIPVAVITPKDNSEPRPTIYMLNGAGGAEQNMDWISRSPILDVYEDKNVNVVIPMEGAFSYYTDWQDQTTQTRYLNGPQNWETFLTKELPGPIEDYLNASHERGIAGMSMSATSALLLAGLNPGFYDAVGSYSGCAATSDPAGRLMAELTVNRGGGTVDQMWGPMGNPNTYRNDALINAEGLRGSEIYVSNASGLAGASDLPGHYIEQGVDPAAASSGAATLIVEGGFIEAATNVCTHNLKAKLDSLGIPAEWNLRPTGTHSWTYWNQDLWDSWGTFDRAFTTHR